MTPTNRKRAAAWTVALAAVAFIFWHFLFSSSPEQCLKEIKTAAQIERWFGKDWTGEDYNLWSSFSSVRKSDYTDAEYAKRRQTWNDARRAASEYRQQASQCIARLLH